MAPKRRTWRSALLEWALGWGNKLPRESNSYTFERVDIPVDDGVDIVAYLYRPTGITPAGTLLIRSPYGFDGFGGFLMFIECKLYATRGYNVLFSGCRGVSGSGGEFEPGQYDAADGQATLTWMRAQPWYTGSFGTVGNSYLGYVQWALLSDPPPDMKAAAIYTGLHDFGQFAWGSGAFTSDVIAWAELLPRAGTMSFLSIVPRMLSQPTRLRIVYDSLPLIDGIEKHFGEETPAWLRRFVATPDLSDPSWKPAQQSQALEKANIPINLVSGWYDTFLHLTVQQYATLVGRGCKVTLTIGPWPHIGGSDTEVLNGTLDLFAEHLAGKVVAASRNPPVRVFVTGAQEWRYLPVWPPPTAPQELCLWPGRKLSKDVPPREASDSTFLFDPVDPTPSIGMPSLFEVVFNTDDTALASRPDVAIFTTEPFEHDLEVFGKPSVELYHSSDNPHVDLLARLSEVNNKNKSHTVTEHYMRLDPNRGPGPLQVDLRDCAHKFRKGTRLRLLLAGGCHPRYIRNLGTGENASTGSTLRPARHNISHRVSAASKLVLPVIVV